MRRVFQAAVILFLLADATLLIYAWPKSRAVAASLAGQNCCPLGAVLQAEANVRRDDAVRERMRAALRQLETDGHLQLWDTPRGRFWIPQSSAGLLHVVLAEQEIEIYGTTRSVHKGDIVLDCGADVGTFTRAALDHGARLVVAIEPMPEKEPCLRLTFAAEIAAGRVIVYPKGVWDKDDVLVLTSDSLVLERHGQSWKVPLTTIDELAAELKLPRVDLIKMDIEGAEKKALQGARRTISQWHPRLAIATEHAPDDGLRIPEAVRAIVPGYRADPIHCVLDGSVVRPESIFFY